MTASKEAKDTFESWAIVELMGHTRLAGRVTEEERFGSKMGRIDIPGPEDSFITQYFSGSSLFRMTPTTEEIARAVAVGSQPEPVHAWELRRLLPAPEVAPSAGSVDDNIDDGDTGDVVDDGEHMGEDDW